MARIAFIGLGHMGGGMAPNLVKAGHEVRAFDLSADALAQAAEGGCVRSGSTEEAVKDADAVITMLPAGKHVAEVYRSHIFGNAPTSALLIDCSTIDVATARSVEEDASAQGYAMVDAPVSGGIAAAAGRHAHFHGRRIGRSVRPRAADPRADGQGGDPCRRRRRGTGREDLQQHDPRRDDDRHVRIVRARAEARPRPEGLLRHRVQGVGPKLVDDQLRAGPGSRPGDPRRPRLRRRVRRRVDVQGFKARDGSRAAGAAPIPRWVARPKSCTSASSTAAAVRRISLESSR